MAYASIDGMVAIYGSGNIDEWADLNNNRNGSEMTAAKQAAIAKADAHIDAVLRRTHYHLPLADASGTVPTEVQHAANMLAGIFLHDWRGQAEGDKLETQRTFVNEFLNGILTGQIRLNCL